MAFYEQDIKEDFSHGVDCRTNYLLYNNTVPVRTQNTKIWTVMWETSMANTFFDPIKGKQSLFIIRKDHFLF